MAAVAVDSARRVRAEASAERRRAVEARRAAQQGLLHRRELLAVGCSEYARRRQMRASSAVSPWSTLPWQQPDDALDRVLILVS